MQLWEYSSVYTMGGTDYDITRDDEGYRSHKFYY